MENQETYGTNETQNSAEMLTIKFSRKLARPFTTKTGKDMVAISDNRAWEEFVLPVTMVHSDHYGSKALWVKLPEDGTTVLSRPNKPSAKDGTWTRDERKVDNKTLKSMVEAYKLKPKTQEAR